MLGFIASYHIFEKELSHGILKYGPVNMGFKLKQMYQISSYEYDVLSAVSISDKHKSWIFLYFILLSLDTEVMYTKYKEFFSSDRRLWHLSIRMSQIS